MSLFFNDIIPDMAIDGVIMSLLIGILTYGRFELDE